MSSPATIGFLEMACHHIIRPSYENDESSVGVGFNFRHIAAAHLGAPLQVSAELIARDGQSFTFKVAAHQAGKVIMTGEHERAVINLDRFINKVTA